MEKIVGVQRGVERPRISGVGELGIFRFVQLDVNGENFLRAKTFVKKHHRVLEDALKEFGLKYVMENKWGVLIPYTAGENYSVVGMGFILVPHVFPGKTSTLDFYGDGLPDYNFRTNEGRLRKLKPFFKEGIQISVDGEEI